MGRRLAAALAIALVAVLVARWDPPRPPPARPPPVARSAPVRGSAAEVSPRRLVSASTSRPDRVRSALAAEAPPAGALGSLAREAMVREGDSDPRLLRALGALGVRPTVLLPVALPLDPWLAAGLVDLERQVGAACAGCAADLEGPVAALSAAAPEVGCVVRAAVDADPAACAE